MTTLLALLIAIVTTFPRDAFAQAPPEATEQLKARIRTAPVVVVNPAIINRAVRPPSAAPPPGATAAPAETTAAAAAATPAAPDSVAPPPGARRPSEAAAATPPVESTEQPPAKLQRGQMYVANLSREDAAQTRALLAKQLAVTAPASPDGEGVHTFDEVVRQVTDKDVEVLLKPYVLVGHALAYEREKKRFAGTVVVGVADLSGSNGSSTLSAPLVFELLESQQRVSLDHLSPPFERFDVSSGATGEPVTVRIASNFSREGISVTVPVERTLFVELDNDNLRGLGLQTTHVTVRAVGGAKLPTGSVSLSAPGAFIVPDNTPVFDAQGLAHAELRSDSPGKVIVTATATGYVPGESSPVTVIWPWQTLLATTVGGIVGGFIQLASRIRRGMSGLRFVAALASAALTGVLVFALYVLGVKLLPVRFAVEVGDLFAFAAAALGGWLGSRVLPQLGAQQA